MKLLVLGGTRFLGRHIVESALVQGHEVVLFNRGLQAPQLFPGVRQLRGDRDGDTGELHGLRVDAVIDTSGYRPLQMGVVQTLSAASHYVFISTVSVYRQTPPGRPYDESAELWSGDEHYGALKARCEETIEAWLPGQVAHVRPGLIVGPHDPTGRFTYWPRRAAEGGEILGPGRPGREVQWMDVRDLAAWCVALAEGRIAGHFNATGPAGLVTMGQLLQVCMDVAAVPAAVRWLSDETLLAAGVQPWSEMPLWLPEADQESGGLMQANCARARAAGLKLRPLHDTVRDTLNWLRADANAGAGSAATLSRERERELLAALKD